MSDKPIPRLPAGVLSEEQIQAIAGGSCTPEQINQAIHQLQDSYESLVAFTSYVIERVAK